MSIEKSLKNAMLTGNGLISWQNNTPTQYAGKQRQYFSPETRTFTQAYAQYSSDFVEAQMQGLDPEDPLAYQTRLLRFSDVVKPSAAIQRHFDDYKMILVADRDIEYIMPGSKIVTMGSTWLAVNPMNVSGSDGSGLVRRCNAVWNHLDFYGNVVSEPIVVENARANASDSDNQQSLLITKGYFNVICQYNDDTRQIDTNTRLILGTGAYRVRGYSDFETEYTGDYSSVRLLSFVVQYEEPNDVIDDMENHVAGGKAFSWNLSISAPGELPVGASAMLNVTSIRNGEVIDAIRVSGNTLFVPETWEMDGKNLVAGSDAYMMDSTLASTACPLNYLWRSSDSAVLSVDDRGLVTALSEGIAIITVTLAENPEIAASVAITVTETGDGVIFTKEPPKKLNAFESAIISAAYYEDGAATNEPLEWTFSGADENAYRVQIAQNTKSATIECFAYSEEPLHINVRKDNYHATANITLEGL